MWIFCKQGFFSAVAHEDNADFMHVRARFKGDLERLIEWAGETPLLKNKLSGKRPTVVHTPDHDYEYRANFTREDWAEIVNAVARDIDYTNFKDSVHEGTARDDAYMSVWATMATYADAVKHTDDGAVTVE